MHEPPAPGAGAGLDAESSGQAVASRPSTDRVRLARLALESALAVDGVVAGYPGGAASGAVQEGSKRVSGVTATVLPGGRFEVGLHLVVAPVPLHPLAERVRDRIDLAASRLGLADRLGPVHVAFEDLVDPVGVPAPAPTSPRP